MKRQITVIVDLHGYSCFILYFLKTSVGDDNTSVLSLEGITLSEVKLYDLRLLFCCKKELKEIKAPVKLDQLKKLCQKRLSCKFLLALRNSTITESFVWQIIKCSKLNWSHK